MLEKIVEVLLSKYVNPKTATQKAEEEVREKIIFLHESILYCHAAYLRHKSDQTDENLIAWRRSIRVLLRVLEEVRLTLATFAPEAYDGTLVYLLDEVDQLFHPGDDALLYPIPEAKIYQLEVLSKVPAEESADYEVGFELAMLLHRLNRLRVSRSKVPVDVLDVFEDATTKLRDFIGSKMTMGEIHKAQQAFEEYIRP